MSAHSNFPRRQHDEYITPPDAAARLFPYLRRDGANSKASHSALCPSGAEDGQSALISEDTYKKAKGPGNFITSLYWNGRAKRLANSPKLNLPKLF